MGREGGEGGRDDCYTFSNGTTLFKLQSRHVLRNNVSRRSIVPRRLHDEQWYLITSDVTWTPGQSPSQINSQSWCTNKLCPFQYNIQNIGEIGSPVRVVISIASDRNCRKRSGPSRLVDTE